MGRSVIRARVALTLLGATAITACGYFNTMYNADRSFSDAERAAARGNFSIARPAYTRAAQKASRSFEKDSLGRYSDDALLIAGRSWFALDQPDSAQLAFAKLAARHDSPLALTAHIWLGATAAVRNQPDSALAFIDQALTTRRLDVRTAGFAHLWRARVRHRLGNPDASLQDVAETARLDKRLAPAASLLGARIALASGDSIALRAHFNTIFAAGDAAVFTDSIRALVAAPDADPRMLAVALAGIDRASWDRMRRDSIALLRVTLLQQTGDTLGAIAEATRIANRSTPPVSDDARFTAATLLLATADNTAALTEIRGLLLPALAQSQARVLVQHLRTLDVLLESATRTGQPLALFVAAELSRDELRAPRLARRLFVTYADVAPGATWTGKALLAAAALPQPPDSAHALRTRIADHAGNVYIAALSGHGDDDAFSDAEERLARTARTLRNDAVDEASRRETVVGRAVVLIDSLRFAAHTDSVRLTCGVLVDSLAVSGIRADSIRSACMRNDRIRIDSLMKVDTLMLRENARVRPDSLRAKQDTTAHR